METLYDFQGNEHRDGAGPVGGLIQVGASFYGVTYIGGTAASGTLFRITPQSQGPAHETVLHNFTGMVAGGGAGVDGAGPQAGLILAGHVLYGTTFDGGSNDQGSIFSYDLSKPSEDAYTLLYSFTGAAPAVQDAKKQRSGCAADTDGSHPAARLLYIGGALWGTTLQGGKPQGFDEGGEGVVFKFDPTLAGPIKPTLIHCFSGGSFDPATGLPDEADGAAPVAGLTAVGDVLYGTTSLGGLSDFCFANQGCGTLFSVDLSGAYKELHQFRGGTLDGAVPVSELTEEGGTVYGTTQQGGGTGCGGNGCGTFFSFAAPETTSDAVSPSEAAVQPITHPISGPPGSHSGKGGVALPSGPLSVHRGVSTSDADSVHRGITAYGVSSAGGFAQASGTPGIKAGTLYKIDFLKTAAPSLPTVSVIADFVEPPSASRCTSSVCPGGSPTGPLVPSKGYLYGVTFQGGAYDSGTVFRIFAPLP